MNAHGTELLTVFGQEYTALLTYDDGAFVAQCNEVDVASQGDTIEHALANLCDALALHPEDR